MPHPVDAVWMLLCSDDIILIKYLGADSSLYNRRRKEVSVKFGEANRFLRKIFSADVSAFN